MTKFIITTDAAADLPQDYIKQNQTKVISMQYMIDGNEYLFGNGESGISISEFYEKLKKGCKASTNLINAERHKEFFRQFLEKGLDIIHVPLSSGLSATFECALAAEADLKIEFPDRKITIIDFKGASMGQGLFVDYLLNKQKEGKSFDEIVKWANDNIFNLCHLFTVDDLAHLRRGGRVSGFAAVVGSVLKIKPVLHVNNEGKLIPIKKTMGRQKSLSTLVSMMKEKTSDSNQRVFISHGDCKEDAEYVAKLITQEFGITDIIIGCIGQIVGLHSGPGTVALFFMGSGRE